MEILNDKIYDLIEKLSAYELVNDCYDLPEFALKYFDYDKLAHDMKLNGDIFTFYYGIELYTVTNANEV